MSKNVEIYLILCSTYTIFYYIFKLFYILLNYFSEYYFLTQLAKNNKLHYNDRKRRKAA